MSIMIDNFQIILYFSYLFYIFNFFFYLLLFFFAFFFFFLNFSKLFEEKRWNSCLFIDIKNIVICCDWLNIEAIVTKSEINLYSHNSTMPLEVTKIVLSNFPIAGENRLRFISKKLSLIVEPRYSGSTLRYRFAMMIQRLSKTGGGSTK